MTTDFGETLIVKEQAQLAIPRYPEAVRIQPDSIRADARVLRLGTAAGFAVSWHSGQARKQRLGTLNGSSPRLTRCTD